MFWRNFVALCNKNGVTPTALCEMLGYSNATATKWKKGAIPRSTTLQKIADYFNVSVIDLIGDLGAANNSYSLPYEELTRLILIRRVRELLFEKGIVLTGSGSFDTALKNMEKSHSLPDDESLNKLASYFDVSVDYLFGKTDERKKPSPELVLSEREKAILEVFRSLSEEKQDKLIEMLENM